MLTPLSLFCGFLFRIHLQIDAGNDESLFLIIQGNEL
jgi:hypothetical protein